MWSLWKRDRPSWYVCMGGVGSGVCVCDSATVVLVVLVQAMGMSGQKLFGVPIMLQPIMDRYVGMGNDPYKQTYTH